jgi:hypothetical protein
MGLDSLQGQEDSLFHHVQTGSWAHTTSYPVGRKIDEVYIDNNFTSSFVYDSGKHHLLARSQLQNILTEIQIIE